jgi:3-hydroxyacyl-CoA dehydrogenase/enoyl-CoA hydratase/3-hydroxybutyryl-CoA epimerase
MAVKSVLQLKRKKDRATLLFSRSDKPVNVLDEACMQALENYLDELEASPPEFLLLQSDITGCFIAGADIHAIAAVKSAEEGAQLAKRGQVVCSRIENLSSVSVAVVQGVCLGGGLELAMACDYIIAVHDDKTRMGLPEIKIGIHPGFGGCVRLPKKVGWPMATQMILSGRIVDAKRAKRIGLADILCHEEQRTSAIDKLAAQGKAKLAHIKPRQLFFILAERKLRAKFQDLDMEQSYPALMGALNALRAISGLSGDTAYSWEADSIGRLAVTPTCKHLIRVFFLGEALKHQEAVKKGKPAAAKLQHTAVYGAGVMGSGIAWVAAKSGDVDLHDVSSEALSHGLKSASTFARRDPSRMQRIRPSLDGSGLATSDMVIEAIVEKIDVKQSLWAEVEGQVSRQTLLLSNTSSLSLSEQQEGLKYPGRLAGLHFFNPAPKMPLVEIIAGKKTTKKTLQTVAALAVHWGKFPVIVADRPGFLVNRCLMPFMTAALRLLEKGQSAKHIDGVLKNFGMPMGAIELADRVGLDICLHVGEHLSSALAGNGQFAMPDWFAKMVADGLLGQKSGSGFYSYNKGKRQEPYEALDRYLPSNAHINAAQEKEFDANMADDALVMRAQDVIDACLIPMLLESLCCLEEGVLDSTEYLDAALVYGIGFPPFRGGLLCYFAGRERSELRQTIADLGFELPANLEVLDDFT